jgi:hypothetical protein
MTPPRCVTRRPEPYDMRPLSGTRNMTVEREGVLVRRLSRGVTRVRRRRACSGPQQTSYVSAESVLHRRLVRAKATVGSSGRGQSAVAQNGNAEFKGIL